MTLVVLENLLWIIARAFLVLKARHLSRLSCRTQVLFSFLLCTTQLQVDCLYVFLRFKESALGASQVLRRCSIGHRHNIHELLGLLSAFVRSQLTDGVL